MWDNLAAALTRDNSTAQQQTSVVLFSQNYTNDRRLQLNCGGEHRVINWSAIGSVMWKIQKCTRFRMRGYQSSPRGLAHPKVTSFVSVATRCSPSSWQQEVCKSWVAGSAGPDFCTGAKGDIMRSLSEGEQGWAPLFFFKTTDQW